MVLQIALGVDEYSKTRLLSRQVQGLRETSCFAKFAKIPIKNPKFWQHRGVALPRTPYRTTDYGQEKATPEIVNEEWPAQYLDGITWLTTPEHKQWLCLSSLIATRHRLELCTPVLRSWRLSLRLRSASEWSETSLRWAMGPD